MLADQWQAAMSELAPMDRQRVLAEHLEIDGMAPGDPAWSYLLDAGAAILSGCWPTGGTWSRKTRGRLIRARGLTRSQAQALARVEIERALLDPAATIAVARPSIARGLVVGWAAARGDTLVLCHTLEEIRRCGVQRLLWASLFPAGKPARHAYEPRGTADFLRRIGTEHAR